MYKKTWFSNEDKLLAFLNKEAIEVVSIMATNNGSSYQLIYKESSACDWEKEYLSAKFLLASALNVFRPHRTDEYKLLEQIEKFILNHKHVRYEQG